VVGVGIGKNRDAVELLPMATICMACFVCSGATLGRIIRACIGRRRASRGFRLDLEHFFGHRGVQYFQNDAIVLVLAVVEEFVIHNVVKRYLRIVKPLRRVEI
jgi:hypothetical protein